MSSSSSSTQSSTTSQSTTSTVPSTFAPIPIHHAVTIRLTKSNFLLWRAQMLPYLRSSRLMGHIDGTMTAPPKMVASSSASGADQVPNPAYDRWYDQDQMVLCGLLASLSEELLQDVVDATTAREAWSVLERMFSSTSRARAVQLRVQLATTKKDNLPAADYFRRMKGYAQTLAAIGMAVNEAELISYILSGLGSDYESFITSMSHQASTITIDDLYAHLTAFETRVILRQQADLQQHGGSSANFAGRRGQHQQGGTTGSRGGRGAPRGGGRARGPGRGHPGRPTGGENKERPTCQICGKEGHSAARCWYRYEEDEQPYANVAHASYKVDSDWITDTGATDHITRDLDRLATRDRYHGGENIQVGNGAGSGVEEKASGR